MGVCADTGPAYLAAGPARCCSPGFAKSKHRYGDVILFFPGPSGGGIGYGFGGLLRGVAQAGAELPIAASAIRCHRSAHRR